MRKVLLRELAGLAREVLGTLSPKHTATILALRGELGAGKTTFVQALATELCIQAILQSPTYVLMKRYAIPNHAMFHTLIHIDAYRLASPQECAALKPEQFLNDPKALVVVEWPEKLGTVLPKPDVTVTFSSEQCAEGERFVKIEK